MWTVCWNKVDGNNDWNRFDLASEVSECVDELEEDNVTDILVIPPRGVAHLHDEMDAEQFKGLYKIGRF